MARQEIYDLKELFEDIQLNGVLEGKTFVDCIPKYDLGEIAKMPAEKSSEGFNSRKFVEENFDMPIEYATGYESDRQKPVEENIQSLWNVLTRTPSGNRAR